MPDDDFDDAVTLDDVVRAIENVEEAVKNKWSTGAMIVAFFVGAAVVGWIGDALHSKWAYSAYYSTDSDRVTVEPHPHDCAFFASPLGEKYCHYDRVISKVYWSTSGQGLAIVSNDDGNTWHTFTPPPDAKVPMTKTLEEVDVGGEKKDDD